MRYTNLCFTYLLTYLLTYRIAAADGWFNRNCQVAPMCPPMWAHWHHLANTIECVLPSSHPSPQPKEQINPFPQNCPLSWGIMTPI